VLIKSLALVLFATLHVPICSAASDKPNFLLVITDDQRWDALGIVQREQGEKARFPWLETPAMDRLAAEGLRFRNAFVTLPLCAPSRAVFMTGRYNHVNGVANNRTPFPDDPNSVQNRLRASGYTTAYFGKWHMGSQRERPGFDYYASFIGQGKYWDCPFEVNGTTTPTKGWVDDVSTSFTIEWLRAHQDKPFFAVLGYKAPHTPHNPPDRAKNRFDGEKSRPVPNLHTAPIFSGDDQTTALGKRHEPAPTNVPHFRSVSAADDALGQLLTSVDELGLTTNTVVVFAGDNGYYHGEHELSDKRSLYEESLRVPLLIRYPKLIKPGTTSDEMVLNADVAPTILELAGEDIPSTMQGKSAKALLAGDQVEWRKSFLAEYFYEKAFPQTPTTVAVRTAVAKLIKYPGHENWTELFDLSKDPYETRNLANVPDAKELRKQMEEEFARQVKATGYSVPAYADQQGTTQAAEQAPARKGVRRRNRR